MTQDRPHAPDAMLMIMLVIIFSLLGCLFGGSVVAAINRQKPKNSPDSRVLFHWRYRSPFDRNVVKPNPDRTGESTMESEMVVYEVFGAPCSLQHDAEGSWSIGFRGPWFDEKSTLHDHVARCACFQNVAIAPGSKPYEVRVGCNKDYLEKVVIPTIIEVFKQKGKNCQLGRVEWIPHYDTDDEFQ